jgi:glycosyltransferase involved in cell wall biosynthesis
MHIGMASLPLRSGGAERLVLEEAKYFADRVDRVSLVTRDVSEEFLAEFDLPENVTIRTYRSRSDGVGSTGFLTETYALHSAIRSLDPDVLFTHYKSVNVYLSRALSDVEVPFTAHVHGSILWFENNRRLLPHAREEGFDELVEAVPGHTEFQGDVGGGRVQRTKAEVEEWLQRRALADCEVVFTGSERVARELEVLYGVDATVVNPGVSREWLAAAGDRERRELMDRENVILAVSRLDPRKRFDLLLRAFARLRERRDDVGLVIGGSGPQREELEAVARDEGITDDVEFAGYVPDEDLPAYYESADAFACPAWMSYGLAPLEAYGVGTKLALASDTFVKERLGDEDDVVVAEPRVAAWVDALDDLLDAPAAPDHDEVVPTWESYCAEKYRVLERRGLIE